MTKDEPTTLILLVEDAIAKIDVLSFSSAFNKIELEKILRKLEYLVDEI